LVTEVSGVSAAFTLDTVGAPPDTDGDGMRDYWEVANGLDPLRNDADEDPDGDGRTNLEEYNAGTNPHVNDWAGPTSAVSPLFLVDTGGFHGPHTRDTDGDGMPDWWEIQYGLDPNLADAAGDADNDGVSNLDEYNAGTNPTVCDHPVDGISSVFLVDTGGRDFDTHGDSLPDWWEKLYFNDPRAAIASGDPDGDGSSNYAEYMAGTSPLDAGSVFAIAGIQVEPETDRMTVLIRWPSNEGSRYSLWIASLVEGPYANIATNVLATPPTNSMPVVVHGASGFFRVGAFR
jgi:hypothetical protein